MQNDGQNDFIIIDLYDNRLLSIKMKWSQIAQALCTSTRKVGIASIRVLGFASTIPLKAYAIMYDT